MPAPAIFLYEDISPTGSTVQHVVDGKQRLTTLFEFIDGRFPVADDSKLEQHRGAYFSGLPDDVKKLFWSYIILVEYVPSDEETITGIFDRINRNTAKLTPQELRHAKFSGEFISAAESLSEWMEATLGKNFPRIVQALDAIDAYVQQNAGEHFPRSLSLLHTVIGVLAQNGLLGTALRGYYPVITDQLRTLFPEVVAISDPFDFQMLRSESGKRRALPAAD